MKNKNQKRIIYADYASSFAPNASAIHELGVSLKKKLEESRKKTAVFLGAKTDEIVFTSGGTEANNLALQGVVWHILSKQKKTLPHIIVSNIEHPSVLETVKLLKERKLVEVTYIPVEENGILNPALLKKEIKKNTVLISVMFANNEIGVLEPIKEIAKEIRHWKKHSNNKNIFGEEYPLLHTDAVQAVHYFDLRMEALGVDMLSLSGSKIQNGLGVGVLFKKREVKLASLLGGGDQEFGIRAGTENVERIYEFAEALESIKKSHIKEFKRVKSLRDFFAKSLEKIVLKNGFEYIINGDFEKRLPNNLNVTIKNIPSDLLVIELSTLGIMISEKSACKSGDKEVSHVIKAIREKSLKYKSPEYLQSLRFSFGESNTKKDVIFILKSFETILKKLKKWYK
ncbi:MAG: cysteine desulfurase [Candidatus Pacebacteria bacterium]|nr:cysteine desulfurase [Candidatus Paceibacterota bacterium]MCF7862936.1 cysteine desulfurase [Candidatus Paceibacterota bacterium]